MFKRWRDNVEAVCPAVAPIIFFMAHALFFSVGNLIGTTIIQSDFLMAIAVKFMAGLAIYRAGSLSTNDLPTLRIAEKAQAATKI